MQIGCHSIENKVLLAPMAGITDQPFRNLCREWGAGLAVSEMVTSNPALTKNPRTLLKTHQDGETGLRAVQILGTDPQQMAQAARLNQERGADLIDINMGCPAKKVCAVAAGSALLRNEALVTSILTAVVEAVSIPVTLKIRTGWDVENRNALNIAGLAEQVGIAALTIHGRTRACKFQGQAEYDTIKQVKQQVKIPIIANGDITSPEKAQFVLAYTGADAVMIGRAAQGKPWIFQQILHYLTGKTVSSPALSEIHRLVQRHLENLYGFYGESLGVKMARKHLGWYFQPLGTLPAALKSLLYQADSPHEQLALVEASFDFFTLQSAHEYYRT